MKRGVLLLALLLAASCAAPPPTTKPRPPSPSPSQSSPTPTPSSVALKPTPTGLYVSQPSAVRGGVSGIFVNVAWSSLESSDQSFTGTGWNQINNAISAVGQIKIRVMAGNSSPGWLKTKVGSVTVHTKSDGTFVIAKYWTAAFQTQYAQLMTEVARRYDANPKVRSVSDSACMVDTAEPFIKGGDPAGADLFAAGDNETNERFCFTTSMASQMAAFRQTHVDLAGHLAWQIPVSGGVTTSFPKERDLVYGFVLTYGRRIIFQDNGLANQTCAASSPNPATATDLWCFMKGLGKRGQHMTDIGFQRGCGSKIANCDSNLVLGYADKLGGCWFEHAGFGDLTATQVADWQSRLAAGCS